MLSEYACQLLEPVKIDFEVSDGFCFEIKGKKIIRNPKRLKGSPRAYVRYTYHEDKIPSPRPFIEGMDKIFFKKAHLMFFLTIFDIFIISY